MSEPGLNSRTAEARSSANRTPEPDSFAPTGIHKLLAATALQRILKEHSDASQQRRTMLIALSLLIATLGLVLYRDRDFWFPDAQEAQTAASQTPATQIQPIPRVLAPSQQTSALKPRATPQKKFHASIIQPQQAAPLITAETSVATEAPAPDATSGDPPPATITRTVLPPLDVEVVAGDNHRTVRPGTNSVHVELQPESSSQSPAAPVSEVSTPVASAPVATETTATVTTNAAERVQMSAATADVVTQSVEPGYPLLARQMKVQGSVVLQALIGRDGLIQDLHILSGPPILANAAQEAVRQWHFKPHLEGAEAVETQAKITVNFTISTN
jgi:TonB family protein